MAKAEKGDLIRIVKTILSVGNYEVGDILEVEGRKEGHPGLLAKNEKFGGIPVFDNEYEIFRKAGEEDSSDFLEVGAVFRTPCGKIRKVKELSPNFVYDEESEPYYRQRSERVVDVTTRSEHITQTEEKTAQDAVEHPNHYTQGRFETIEVIEQFTSGYDDGFVAHCVGTATKYIARAPYKHETPLEDLRKAAKYLEFAIGRLTQNER